MLLRKCVLYMLCVGQIVKTNSALLLKNYHLILEQLLSFIKTIIKTTNVIKLFFFCCLNRRRRGDCIRITSATTPSFITQQIHTFII